jgi:hypothetical protein
MGIYIVSYVGQIVSLPTYSLASLLVRLNNRLTNWLTNKLAIRLSEDLRT